VTIAVKVTDPVPAGSRLAVRTVVEEVDELELFMTKFSGVEKLEA
jgi:acyl dehydratase